ncbi:MAG TPA: hypothetical protein DGG95_03230 [Cytophagales bacterium]|jgi:hypothetical protein|nr:hypothetical protein [Cytophagales bacterium]
MNLNNYSNISPGRVCFWHPDFISESESVCNASKTGSNFFIFPDERSFFTESTVENFSINSMVDSFFSSKKLSGKSAESLGSVTPKLTVELDSKTQLLPSKLSPDFHQKTVKLTAEINSKSSFSGRKRDYLNR